MCLASTPATVHPLPPLLPPLNLKFTDLCQECSTGSGVTEGDIRKGRRLKAEKGENANTIVAIRLFSQVHDSPSKAALCRRVREI